MEILIADKWQDYELIDTRYGEKLERFGDYTVIRPDPQVIWYNTREHTASEHNARVHTVPGAGLVKYDRAWDSACLRYHRDKSGGGSWEIGADGRRIPNTWEIGYKKLRFIIKPTDFKHMGIFPEQAVNWDWISDVIQAEARRDRDINVLNLFAYTGGATLAASGAGARVCHVDASKGMNQWAKNNLALSGLGDRNVRFITDDVMKFVLREARRGTKYDGIIMDPPVYGRGPGGELWKITGGLHDLVKGCVSLLSDRPLFFLINSYTAGFSPVALENVMKCLFTGLPGGRIYSGEIGLRSGSGLVLPCGIFGRWELKNKER